MTTRLKDNFTDKDPVAAISHDWLNTVARWLNSLTVNDGLRTADPFKLTLYDAGSSGAVASDLDFSFKTTRASANTATMVPGDVRFGPDTLVAWASFTGESTTVTVTAGNNTWYVWLVIDVENEAVTWNQGASVTALSGADLLNKINWPLVKITSVDNDITGVKHLHMGDVVVSRAAG